MKKIEVRTSKEYEVRIGSGLLGEAGRLIGEVCGCRRIALVTDSNVAGLYADKTQKALSAEGFDVSVFTFPAGEESKNGNTLLELLGFMANRKLTRGDLVVALGGGVTGDLAGLAAAMYMRGIEYVQIPTTVLAAVDSSVGGKTAIDLPQGKNLAGAFHQPSLVLIDTDVFETLPERDYGNGFAEVIKYGMIRDPEIIDILLRDAPSGRLDRDEMENIIVRCVSTKARIVEEDEFDSGIRQILNFGHTIGHALEKASDYSIYHGEAIAMGMIMMTEAAVRGGMCEGEALHKLKQALSVFDLPREVMGGACEDKARLLEGMAVDKKNTGEGINVVIPEKIGRCIIRNMSPERLAEFL